MPSTTTDLLPTLRLTRRSRISASGSASLDIGPGNVVAVVTSLTLEMATADVVTGNTAITGLGASAGTIDDAKVLAVHDQRRETCSWAPGGVTYGARWHQRPRWRGHADGRCRWVLGSGASFSLATVSKGTTSFTGLKPTYNAAFWESTRSGYTGTRAR